MNASVAFAAFVTNTGNGQLKVEGFKNDSVVEGELSNPFRHFLLVLCSLVVLIGVLGNLLVIVVFGLRFRKLKNSELFMLSLAVADLLGATFVPAQIVIELRGRSLTPIGDTGCQLLATASITSVTVSALTLLAIAIDRFYVVKWPMRRRIAPCRMLFVVALTWLVSFSLGIPYFVDSRVRLVKYQGYEVCRTFWKSHAEDRAHTIVVFLVQVVFPIAYISVLYPLIIVEMRRTSGSLFATQSSMLKARIKKHRVATFMMLLVIGAFYLFILPVNFFYLAYTFGGVHMKSRTALAHTYFFLQAWAAMNTAVNPVIYSKLHKSFRKHSVLLVLNCFGLRSQSSALRSPDSFRTSVFSCSSRGRANYLSNNGSFRSCRDVPSTPGVRASLCRSDSSSPLWEKRHGSQCSNGSGDMVRLRPSTGDINHNLHIQLLVRLHGSPTASDITSCEEV